MNPLPRIHSKRVSRTLKKFSNSAEISCPTRKRSPRTLHRSIDLKFIEVDVERRTSNRSTTFQVTHRNATMHHPRSKKVRRNVSDRIEMNQSFRFSLRFNTLRCLFNNSTYFAPDCDYFSLNHPRHHSEVNFPNFLVHRQF